MFAVAYSEQARRFLKRATMTVRRRVLQKIEGLRTRPVGHDAKRVHGYKEKTFRVRVGEYRILYEVDHRNQVVGVVKLDKRERAY